MTSENPYNAPSAALGTAIEPLEGDLAHAVQGFIVTRTFIRLIAILALVVLAFSVLGFGLAAMAPSTVSKSTQLVGMGTVIFIYGVFGIMLFRLSSPLYALAEHKTWENVTFVFQRMTQTWTMGIVTFVLMLLGGFALRFTGAMAAIAGAQVVGANDTVGAARQLRNMLRVFVGLAASSAVLNVLLTWLAPMQSQAILGATFMWGTVVGGLVVQAVILFFVWRHVPALDTFIAQPSAATLAHVAHAHRMLWRLVLVVVVLLIAIAVLGVNAAIAIPSVVGLHK